MISERRDSCSMKMVQFTESNRIQEVGHVCVEAAHRYVSIRVFHERGGDRLKDEGGVTQRSFTNMDSVWRTEREHFILDSLNVRGMLEFLGEKKMYTFVSEAYKCT
ncbi:hypothetical protein NPIL_290571 [Nephila pilipes]|uniref:Uncharacterized protein n=1 Tax=Nephila pilipes TaxID=299642 RepID=A0A8X6QVK7_NEPPI|nr:hypothetical protein NPIL_290571 [Nephila pilipes]